MDSVERLNKIFYTDTGEPELPFLKSRKFKDIIECLEQSYVEVQYRRKTDDPDFFLEIDQEAWLSDVANYSDPSIYEERGIPEPINWSDNRDIAFAILNLAKAGQQLNVKKCFNTNGQPPWDFMGDKVKPYVVDYSLDVHYEEDIYLTEKWIEKVI